MEPLAALLAVNREGALTFFAHELQDVSGTTVDREELLYNASVLAHYAQVSTSTVHELPAPADLVTVFDTFVTNSNVPFDSTMLETAGAQCLLLTGFFEDQLRARHSIPWFSRLGAGFYARAASRQTSVRKAHLLSMLAEHFEPWRRRQARLSRVLRDRPFLFG